MKMSKNVDWFLGSGACSGLPQPCVAWWLLSVTLPCKRVREQRVREQPHRRAVTRGAATCCASSRSMMWSLRPRHSALPLTAAPVM